MTYGQRAAGLENIPVDVIVPFLPLPKDVRVKNMAREYQVNRNALSSAALVVSALSTS